MVTEKDKLLRLADALAKRHGLELVVHETHGGPVGPAVRLSFEDPNSFTTEHGSIIVYLWRETAGDAFARCEALFA